MGQSTDLRRHRRTRRRRASPGPTLLMVVIAGRAPLFGGLPEPVHRFEARSSSDPFSSSRETTRRPPSRTQDPLRPVRVTASPGEAASPLPSTDKQQNTGHQRVDPFTPSACFGESNKPLVFRGPNIFASRVGTITASTRTFNPRPRSLYISDMGYLRRLSDRKNTRGSQGISD